MAMNPDARIHILRRRVRAVDEGIIRLLGRRFRLTNRIGALKHRCGRPILDRRIETVVQRRARTLGLGRGLDADVVRSIFSVILAGSRSCQQAVFDDTYPGDPERILIVGGSGAMGRWFTGYFRQRGHSVIIYDPRRPCGRGACPTLEQGLSIASMVMIACPMGLVPSVIDRLSDLRYPGIVFDIASVKAPLEPSIARARRRGLALASIHPMFGPNARRLDPKIVCLCDCGSRRAMRRIRSLFRGPLVTLVPVGLKRHDRLVAYVLGLSHAVNIVFARLVARSGLPLAELRAAASTTFRRQLDTALSVVGEDPHLYYSIQRFNPHRQVLYKELLAATRRLAAAVGDDQGGRFVRLMASGRALCGRGRNTGG